MRDKGQGRRAGQSRVGLLTAEPAPALGVSVDPSSATSCTSCASSGAGADI